MVDGVGLFVLSRKLLSDRDVKSASFQTDMSKS
jgi:hypothetical protein